MGFADVEINGKNYTVGGFAGLQEFSTFAPVTPLVSPEVVIKEKLPSTYVNGSSAHNDAEINILEQILRDTTNSSTGNIRLVVDRTSCTSCADSAIQEFYRRRPGITLNVVQGKRIN